jgi:DNA-binding NtrC family response regulator
MKLLVVDDEAAICEMLKEYFEDSMSCRVLTATSPSSALLLLEKEQPEGMLLDLNFRSKLNGFDILKKAAAISPSTKVIMVTSVNDFESVEKAVQLGAVDYVTKPFTMDYLEDTVRTKIASLLVFAE